MRQSKHNNGFNFKCVASHAKSIFLRSKFLLYDLTHEGLKMTQESRNM
jgi:hypothetical protein